MNSVTVIHTVGIGRTNLTRLFSSFFSSSCISYSSLVTHEGDPSIIVLSRLFAAHY